VKISSVSSLSPLKVIGIGGAILLFIIAGIVFNRLFECLLDYLFGDDEKNKDSDSP
jgi:hypothetical protein